jgi:hypothetical protein
MVILDIIHVIGSRVGDKKCQLKSMLTSRCTELT